MNEFITDKKFILQYKNIIFKTLREYLENKNFVEIHTPMIVPIATDPIRGDKK